MLETSIQKPLSALHVWVWIPVPLGTSQELVHSVEHRIFLDPKIAALEDRTVRHNGMTCWSGIRLEFTIVPERFEELRCALAELFSKPLPKMSFEERERFAREIEEGGGDFFDRSIDRFRTAFSEANGFEHSGKDEDAIWQSLDFSSVRLLAVGNRQSFQSTEGSVDFHGWSPAVRTDLVFPTLKEELFAKTEDAEYGFSDRESGMDYVIILPSIVEDASDLAFHALFFQHVRLKADSDFRDTGRTYDPIVEDYFEDGFAISGMHLMTSDTSKRLPALPKKPARAEFENTRDSLAFQQSIYLDQLLYGSYPISGILPKDALSSLSSFSYQEFSDRFNRAVDRVSIFWGNGE
ncbi:MAG: hypothetical protein QG650_697 [Patescibacteria group bacterium]|nr:hypothetical protein [Patescibacteria group bacterium]